MTIRVEITAETPEQYRALVLALTGRSDEMSLIDILRARKPDSWTHQERNVDIGMSPEYAEANSGVIDTAVASGDLRPAAAHPDEGGPATPAEPAPAKARRRTKAEIEAAKAADAPAPLAEQVVNRAISETPEERTEPVADEQPAAQPEPTPTVETVTLSHDDIRRALKVIVDSKGMPVATKALMDLGYGKTSDVPAEKIGEVIAALQAVAA